MIVWWFLIPMIFHVLMQKVLRRPHEPPVVSQVFVIFVGVSSMVWHMWAWEFGVTFVWQGLAEVKKVASYNVGFFILLRALSTWATIQPSFLRGYLLNVLLAIWLLLYAFPWFGQTP